MLQFKKENYLEYQSKTFRLPVAIIEKIEKIAAANNTSATKIVIQCLEYALAHADNDDGDNRTSEN